MKHINGTVIVALNDSNEFINWIPYNKLYLPCIIVSNDSRYKWHGPNQRKNFTFSQTNMKWGWDIF